MALPDVTTLTLEELRILIGQLATEINAREQAALDEKQNSRDQILAAKTTLEGLLGPVGAAPGTESIRAILAFGDEVIGQNVTIVVPMIIHGLEVITATMIEVTKLVDQD